ncbi:DsbA family oxidoreductase [Aquibacillus kalidii]|uniref:DsbA family oxidoreductase n=1 Tax=Aquibacillus kalidii TaxID=2762597 RepID=UPI0016492AFD|nr:DsbA family oxidoreductase [Aquibacillus kalidii]
MKIEVWSDFVCPFCYIGKRRLELALDQFAHKDQVEIEYKSFELDPHAPKYTEKSIYESLATKFGTSEEQVIEMNQGLIQQAAEIGLTYNYDDMKPTNTFDAHRLAKYAQTVGKESEITEKLLYSYFTESKNVGDIETLIEIAEIVGLDKNKTSEVLNNTDAFADKVRADQKQAQQHQITGVPFFLINDKYAISGAQPLEAFQNAIQKVWEEENPKPQFLDLSSNNDFVCNDESCIIPTDKK